jgi:hypothetical protein
VQAGLDTNVELRQGEGSLPETRQQIEALDEQIELLRHALAALTAQPPRALAGLSPKLNPVQALPLPAAVPADLLGRRADIAAARWRIGRRHGAGHPRLGDRPRQGRPAVGCGAVARGTPHAAARRVDRPGRRLRRQVQRPARPARAGRCAADDGGGPVWVDANFKDGQLRHLHVGQPVTLTADAYGDKVEFHGAVQGLSAGTGSVFLLLPAQNATGNWIKVV